MSTTTDITLDMARALIANIRAEGRKLGLKPLSVVVLDRGGNVTAFEREDGASNLRFNMAYAKAYGCIGVGLGGRAMMARAETQAYFVNSLTAAFGGNVLPVPGGILLRAEAGGAIIGAVGITGDTSDQDEAAGLAGIAAAGLVGDGG
ncbi:MAG: heme-binding protein [Pseudomonadota bacterium]